MLTFNKQHLKLAFGNALKNRVAADFLFHITVHSEKKKEEAELLYLCFLIPMS